MECEGHSYEYILLLQCSFCFNGIVAKFSGHEFGNWMRTNGQHRPLPKLVECWPKADSPSAPKHIPDNIRSFFLQGLDSLRRRGFDAAGTMFRKSLDTALKRIHSDGKGTLQKRIDALPPELGITPAMKEWAHEIRDLGNDAAHDEEPFTEAEAKALHAFTELFLTYAFTLPGMLAERKAQEPPV
jgi:hypothetical protein